MKTNSDRHRAGRCVAVLAMVAILFVAETCQAGQETVLTRFNTAGATLGGLSSNGGSVSLNVTASAYGINNLSTSAGAFLTQRYDASGLNVVSSFVSFCADLNNGVASSPTTANVGTISANPDSRNLVAAGWVMQRLGSVGIGGFLAGASGASSSARNAGAQLAIWAVTFSTNAAATGPNFGPGFSVSTNGSTNLTDYNNAVRIANNMIADWINGGRQGAATGLIDYRPYIVGTPPPGTSTGQDQIFVPTTSVALIPEPSTIALGASGLVFGLLAHVIRRRRRS